MHVILSTPVNQNPQRNKTITTLTAIETFTITVFSPRYIKAFNTILNLIHTPHHRINLITSL
ncbi:hypothetical protein BTUL_0031g00640 [Botrytis tulipae]|uniref:Uncharacterized protein n=1 Tax=Botrytis tulipae TaxID=87230 RepID=A0A4Z1EYC0_9HELO|nr:hypothetical protein BTUL_0031g00640 [Botrytis tulipae]